MGERKKKNASVFYCGYAFTANLASLKNQSKSRPIYSHNNSGAKNEGGGGKLRVAKSASNATTISRCGVNHKLWLEGNGATFGDGLFNILINIDATGSISQAARQMNMSYRAAWGKIKFAEERWGVPLLITHVGGEMGGGASLTPDARELLDRFRKLRQVVNSFINYTFEDIFRGWPTP